MIKSSLHQFLVSNSDNRKSKSGPADQNLKWVGIFAIALTFVFGEAVAQAQRSVKIPRIGFLTSVSPSTISARTDAFRQGLRELGYVEGKNIIIEWRYAEEKPDRLSAFVAELVRLKVDVIVSAAPAVTRPVKQATKTIPIIMAFDDDPVGNGFVTSLARPGGNITGLSNLSPEISGKQLETAEGDRSQANPSCSPRNFDASGQCSIIKRDRTCRSRVRCEGSIPRRTRFKGP